MNKQRNKAFTLVELIVIITILAILGTIAFISLQGYSAIARNSRRISDTNNIKKSLELFSINSGIYPLPDNGEQVKYDSLLLRTQGFFGNNTTKNLSKNLGKKPIDPLLESEYIYSVTNSQKEYELMSFLEGDYLINYNLLNKTYATNKFFTKVEGTYNQIFIKTSKHIIPTPSIINSEYLPLDLKDKPNAIQSSVITNGNNIPKTNTPLITTQTGKLNINFKVFSGSITKDSSDEDKQDLAIIIQETYSGSSLASNLIYKNILSKTDSIDLISIVENIILNNNYQVPNSNNQGTSIQTCDSTTKTINSHIYNINSINYGSSTLITSNIYGITGGTAISNQNFICNNGIINEDGGENQLLTGCNTDYYSSNSISCESVGNGYYSDSTSTTRLNCTNKPSNSNYTSSGNGTNNCTWACGSGYNQSGESCVLISCNWVLKNTYGSSGVNCRTTYPATSNPSGSCTCGENKTVYECSSLYLSQCAPGTSYGCKPLRYYNCE